MLKDYKETFKYLTVTQANEFETFYETYSKIVKGSSTEPPTLNSLFKNVCKSGYGILSKHIALFRFLCIEVGDRELVSLDVPIVYGDSYRKLKFGKGFPVIFTVTHIDYANLRMDGYIDNNYFVTGIYHSDFIYCSHIGSYTPTELSDMVTSRNALAVYSNKFRVVPEPVVHPIQNENNNAYGFPW